MLHWLYVVTTNDDEDSITQIHFAIRANESIAAEMKEFENRKFAHVSNPQTQGTNALISPLKQLLASSITTQETLLRMLATQERGLSASTLETLFANILESYRNILLNASSIGKARSYLLCEEAMDFFHQSGIKQAHIHMNSLLDGK